MVCKYDIIDEGGRKRVRALRHFTVQGRDVCPMELGGYVYDDKTLSQEGNCWIFSGSLEYPGVRVIEEAIVDMGVNLAPPVTARQKSVVISGNSRIMGPIQFTGSGITGQTGVVWEQGTYNVAVGMVPVKAPIESRIRIAANLFGGSAGKVAITSPSYEARIISIDSDGLVTSGGAWTAGGPAVTLTTTSPYFLVELRKTPTGAITPADVTTAGVTVTTASETSLEITNSSIIALYNGVIMDATKILAFRVSNGKSTVQNSSIRIEASAASSGTLNFLADFDKVNAVFTSSIGNVDTAVNGIFIRSNVTAPGNLVATGFTGLRQFVVKDCPEFTWSPTVFPAIADFRASGKVFTFNRCNMPVGSAIHYYDPKVTVWDNIDFTRAMADLGKANPAQSVVILVSSEKQGMYRTYGAISKTFGVLVESLSSIRGLSVSSLADSYDSIIYSDAVITGLFGIKGRNVFGGKYGGNVEITNTGATPITIDGSFRIDGNAQVTDTPLKGTGYIGGNAELKNGVVEGYIYMSDNAKYIPSAVETPRILRRLVMSGNSKVLKQGNTSNHSVDLEMYDNATIDGVVHLDRGSLVMRDDSFLERSDSVNVVVVFGRLTLEGKASVSGNVTVNTYGDITLTGGFTGTSGSIYGKRVISDPSQIAVVELPPTKITW